MNKKTLFIVAGVLVAMVGITMAIVAWAYFQTPSTTNDSTTTSGKVVCLPKKGSGPQTMECALGIQTSDGKYYAVKSLDTDTGLQNYPMESSVKVTGVTALPSSDEIYNVTGVITASEISKSE